MDFEQARRRRLAESDNTETKPLDALRLAEDWIAENGNDHAVIVLERAEGGVVIFSAGTTQAETVYLLEEAKLTLMFGHHE